MFARAMPSKRRKRSSKTKTLQAPTLGWVTEENIIAGRPGTARQLVNWFPNANTVGVRRGHASHSDTGETTPVNTLIAYHLANGNKSLYAACNDTIYNVTGSSASATSITSLTSSKLEWVNFAATTTNYIFAVNGTDSAITFDGTTWANPSITGVSSSSFTNVAIFKRRLFFTLLNSLQFAYLPVGNIAGAAATFDLGPEFSKGGYLIAIGVWTMDGGAGQDDHICFITSEGQVSIYQGDDPSDANHWAKVGTYNLPKPIGKRCVMQVGGDVYLVTEAGIIALRESLALDISAATANAVTKNIQSAVNTAADLYRTNFGWQLLSYAAGKMAILNVPLTESETQHQYVMNSVTGAWCKFTGMNANCFAVLGDELYFGGNDGVVYKAHTGASDNGADIIADYESYYDYFGAPGLLKDWKIIQPIIYADGSVVPAIGLNVDFEDSIPVTSILSSTASIIRWGEFNWDEASWSAERTLSKPWISLNASKPGYAGAVRMRAVVTGSGSPVTLEINAFNLIYEVGSPL